MRPSTFVACVAVILAITACSRAPHVIVFNRTGDSLTIQRTPPYEADMAIAPGGARRIRFPDSMELTVVTGAATWRYAVRFPPREMARWSKLGTPEFQFQVEADGRVYVLPPTVQLPASELPPQPPGFPISPMT
jgi:hypothetical protein